MGNAFTDFFGGGTEQVPVMTPMQINNVDFLNEKILGQLQAGVGGPWYEGQIAPDATANQQAAFGAAGGLLGNAQGYVDPSQATQQALSGQPAYEINPEAREQFYQESIYNPAKNSFNDTLQGLDHRYRGFGQSGAQFGQASRAAADFEVGMGAQRGQLHMQDEMRRQGLATDAANRQLGGIGAANQGNQAGNQMRLQNLGMLGALGSDERAIQGQQNSELYNKWEGAQAYNNPWVNKFLGTALSAQPYANVAKPGILDQINSGVKSASSIVSGVGSFF